MREELGRPYVIEPELESTGARIEPADVLGKPLALLLNLDGTNWASAFQAGAK